jgi:hypothetical protein
MTWLQINYSNYNWWNKNAVINGITDWVYEEEFAFVRAFDWSKDKWKAYIRFDESQVPEFSMSMFHKICTYWNI